MKTTAMNIRPEYRSETGKLIHEGKNRFRYGQTYVTKYIGGYCEATLGNALRWEADSEKELIERIDKSGYGPTE